MKKATPWGFSAPGAVRPHGFIFEPKLDNFALAHVRGHRCELVSRNGHIFKKLLFRREWPHFYAFDVLSLGGEDLTGVPLLERKARLLRILPRIETRLLYLDHIEHRVRDLFRVACERDLEGIVARWAHGPYQTDGRRTSWVKIKNATYSQIKGRHGKFEQRRHLLDGRGRMVRPELTFF